MKAKYELKSFKNFIFEIIACNASLSKNLQY